MFSARVLDHFHNPRNVGPLETATHQGVAGIPGDGPYLLLWFEVVQGVIARASYDTYGCPAVVACGSLTAEVLIGRTPEQALLLQPNDITLLLGGLPEGRAHCPQLAIEAVKNAFREEGD